MKRAWSYMSAAALFVAAAHAGLARADDAIDAWARWAVAPKVWKGQVVVPEPSERPSGFSVTIESREAPLRVHAEPGRARQAPAILADLERSNLLLRDEGWIIPDTGFDAYLVPGLAASEARVDAFDAPSDFDAAQTYALVPASLSAAQRETCVHSAFVQAAMRALEPAEADTWVRATGDFAAWQTTGEPGCGDSMVQGQREPEHSMLGRDLAAAGSGALFLALLSERHDAGSGAFVRALWELARQRSKSLVPDDELRGSPDVWEVLARVLESADERWPDLIEEFGVARFFAGEPSRRAAAAYRVFAGLPSDAAVPLLADLAVEALPRRVRTDAERGIEPLGSAYVRLSLGDAACAAGSCELRVWLRGELGPRWALTAVRLDAEGRDLGRTRAPARDVPEAYLPVALTADTRLVVLVVTHLPRSLPDADRPVPAPHGVELALDLLGRK